jgi:hypothetical protein
VVSQNEKEFFYKDLNTFRQMYISVFIAFHKIYWSSTAFKQEIVLQVSINLLDYFKRFPHNF